MSFKLINQLLKLDKILSLLLRFSGIGGKFILLILITKYKTLEFQGSYTIINQSIALMIYFVGLDFYTYYTKKVVKNIDNCIFYFKNALVLYCFSGLIVSVFFVLISVFYIGLDYELIVIILILFALEHLGQELMRIYIALSKIPFANFLLFLRTGLWALIASGILFITETINIQLIFSIWLVCSFLSVVIGFYFFPNIRNFFKEKINKKLIKKGVVFSIFIFLSTICLRLIEYSDKYILAFFESEKQVGIYSVYFQISNIFTIIVTTIILAFVYPKILLYSQELNKTKLDEIKKEVINGASLIFFIILFGYIFFNGYLYEFLEKKELIESRWLVLFLLVGSFFLNISNYYNIILMGLGKVKIIFYIGLAVLFLNLILNIILVPIISIYGSALTQLLCGIVFYFLRRKYTNKLVLNFIEHND